MYVKKLISSDYYYIQITITNFAFRNHKQNRSTYHDKEKKPNNFHDSNHDYAILAPG